jgi:hypothetical protein
MKRVILMASLVLGLGSLLVMSGCASTEKEGAETKVKLADCPKPVQDTLTQEAQGGQIGVIDKEEDGGKVTYETDVVINGKNYEIRVAPDGTLIGKKLDEEKDEKKEDEKK